jgi:hypothetical protein
VIIDEAAFHEQLGELIKAAMALLMWGGQVHIISTHNGADNPFNELIQDIRAKKRPYSLHTRHARRRARRRPLSPDLPAPGQAVVRRRPRRRGAPSWSRSMATTPTRNFSASRKTRAASTSRAR